MVLNRCAQPVFTCLLSFNFAVQGLFSAKTFSWKSLRWRGNEPRIVVAYYFPGGLCLDVTIRFCEWSWEWVLKVDLLQSESQNILAQQKRSLMHQPWLSPWCPRRECARSDVGKKFLFVGVNWNFAMLLWPLGSTIVFANPVNKGTCQRRAMHATLEGGCLRWRWQRPWQGDTCIRPLSSTRPQKQNLAVEYVQKLQKLPLQRREDLSAPMSVLRHGAQQKATNSSDP